MQLFGSSLRLTRHTIVLCTMLWATQACHSTSQDFELKLGHALDRTHPVH